MKNIFAVLLVCLLGLTGCARINPRLDEKIDNQNGKIDDIKNNQNGVMADIGNLKLQTQQNGSTLKDVQQGYLNVQSHLLSRENSGIQIFQGDGFLMLIFGLGVIGMVLYHYRSQAKINQQAADIMAQQIAHNADPEFHEKVFQAAMHTEAEGTIYRLVKKYKN